MMKNTVSTYGSIAKLFHWGMFSLFFFMFIVAYIMINISKSDFRMSLYDLHKATGIMLFCFVILRLGWRLINIRPSLAVTLSRFQIYMAKFIVLSLYILMFMMPITGFLTSTLGGHPISIYLLMTIQPLAHNNAASLFFSEVHELLSYLLIFIFSLHVLGSLYHHYFIKDDVLKRMWIKKCAH